MSHFSSDLCLRNANEKDDGQWLTTQSLRYQSDHLGREIFVPEKFQTDLASVPRLWAVYAIFGGRANEASVVHDFLYSAPHQCTRRQADAVLYEAMVVTMDLKWMAWFMWLGVRMGGWLFWE